MRKRYKVKKKSCALCKPFKQGWEKRWKAKDEAKLKEFEELKNNLNYGDHKDN